VVEQHGTKLCSGTSEGLVLVIGNAPPNKRLKLAARIDWGMNLSSARRSLSAIR